MCIRDRYEVCMQSRKPIAKQMKKEIKKYLKSIRLTGAAIPEGREQEMVNYYFSSLSSDLQGQIVNEKKNNSLPFPEMCIRDSLL